MLVGPVTTLVGPVTPVAPVGPVAPIAFASSTTLIVMPSDCP